MAEHLDHFEPTVSFPTRAILLSVLGPTRCDVAEPEQDDDALLTGAAVEVRTRYFPGQWAPGYEVVETLNGGYRIRRRGSQDVLTEVFATDDVRVASDPPKTDNARTGPKNGRPTIVKSHPILPVDSEQPPAGEKWIGWIQTTVRRESDVALRLGQSLSRSAMNIAPFSLLRHPLEAAARFGHSPQDLTGKVMESVFSRLETLRSQLEAIENSNPARSEDDAHRT